MAEVTASTLRIEGLHTMDDHGFPLITVTGTSYEMGFRHGVQAQGMIRRYLRLIELTTRRLLDVLWGAR